MKLLHHESTQIARIEGLMQRYYHSRDHLGTFLTAKNAKVSKANQLSEKAYPVQPNLKFLIPNSSEATHAAFLSNATITPWMISSRAGIRSGNISFSACRYGLLPFST